MSQRSTTVGLLLPSADTRTISQAFTWNDLGQAASTGYPDDLGIGTDPTRTVSFTYTNGFLTAVPSFAGSISHDPNTMVNQVAGRRNQYGLHVVQTWRRGRGALLYAVREGQTRGSRSSPLPAETTRRAIASPGAVTAPGT